MELSKNLLEAFNSQIQKEYNSAYIYKGMEMYFKDLGLGGFERFFHVQVEEEIGHAEDFINNVVDRGGKVELFELDKPKTDYGSILEVFEAALEHEKFITKSITELLEEANKENDYAAQNFLRKYIDEQVEEEATFQTIVDTLKFISDDKAALFSYANSLGQRG